VLMTNGGDDTSDGASRGQLPDDAEGFDEFFVRILPRTIRVARRLTGDPWIAEDVAVEALARAHARWARVEPLAWRDAWVLKVASREALHHVRLRPPMPARGQERNESDDAVLRIALVAALIRLPRRQRESIVLRYLCDLSEADVALSLGVSVGTVKTHLHRALTSLHANFRADFEEGYVHELDA